MSRLIDADALLADVHNAMCADCEDECAACQWRDAIKLIEDAPTVGNGMADAEDWMKKAPYLCYDLAKELIEAAKEVTQVGNQ